MSDHPRNRHEFTIDEAAEFQVAFLRESRAGSSLRRRDIRRFAIVFAATAFCTTIFVSATDESPFDSWDLIVCGVVAALASPIGSLAYARAYDDLIRRRTRRYLREQYGGGGPHPCTIEVRPEGIWTATIGVEIQFAWSEATGVVDAPEGITVWFTGGGAMARARGFASPEERERFLRRIRELLPPGVTVSEAPGERNA